MNLNALFAEINRKECYGYSPASASTKPAHIANGWFRRLIGKAYDAELLNRMVMHWTKSGEVNPSEELLNKYPGILGAFRRETNRRTFDRFRANLKALVSPYGGAVNNGSDRSSYNTTCEKHLTKDMADNSGGAFLYHLATTDLGRGESPVVELLKRSLKDMSDEISTVCLPLLKEGREQSASEGSYLARSVFRSKGGRFASPTIQHLREGLDQLARFEEACGAGLDSLRRIAAYGAFAILMHMPNRQREMMDVDGVFPCLLYFQGRRRTTAYQASHYTYNLARQAIETLYSARIKEAITDRLGKNPDDKKCEQFIKKDIVLEGKAETVGKRLPEMFRAYRSQMSAGEALAEAVRDVMFRGRSGNPVDFYRGLGVRVGLLKPPGNSATRKFYTLEGSLLEAVLGSILTESQMRFPAFLDRLYEQYGIVTGGRPEDAKILRSQGVGQATVEDLKANAAAFRQQLVALGWGRQYADGVLSVHIPEGMQ